MTKKLAVPDKEKGEIVDECYYSRTGWAIWTQAINGGGCGYCCTCRPAKVPRGKLGKRLGSENPK
jgi:hypothetical protein